MNKKDVFYITTSIPYLNGAPHLGFALEVVQADSIARYQRLQGKETFFLSGADEHGAKIARSAEAAGKEPREFVDAQVVHFLDLLKKLNISNDDFIRTSDQKRHWPGAQMLWEKMWAVGDIYKGKYRGLYCVGHEAFITEKDIENDVCKLHKKPPEAVEEENYFFKLSKYVSFLRELISSDTLRILPDFRKQEVLNMLDDSADISFSRPSKDLSWGVPVPNDATQTMYVWCDALSNYITALGYGTDGGRFSKFWPADIHVIGKDIIRFHAIFWPAMLQSAGLPTPKTIFIHGFVNNKGEKMSKSLGNVVNPFPLIEKYGHDAVRFYLAHEVATFGDSDYSEEHFHEVYQGVLVNGLGNLVSRTVTMMKKLGSIKKPSAEDLVRYPLVRHTDIGEEKKELHNLEETSVTNFIDGVAAEYQNAMQRYAIGEAIQAVARCFGRLDEYIEHYKIYTLIKSNPTDAALALWNVGYALFLIAEMLRPFMPDTAERIVAALGADADSAKDARVFTPKEVNHLFPRIEKKEK